jgi:hypothetical protein
MKDFEAYAQDLLGLFVSNERSIGRFHPKNGKMETVYQPLQAENFIDHLHGSTGVGAVPILDDSKCHWGAIDIDNHGQEEDTPIAPIDEIVMAEKLPLIICRSKSGGVHAYVFFDSAVSAATCQQLLSQWAKRLGYPDAEIFPKQKSLRKNPTSGAVQLGNWINLPYFAAGTTNRYAFRNGKVLTLGQFVDLATKLRVSSDDIKSLLLAEHVQAPPCVQRMLAEGVGQGSRNEAAFHIGVYLRKSYPAEVEARLRAINNTIFEKPLPSQELKRTIISAQRPDYHYRCNIDPQLSLCDRPTCLTREFGISVTEAEEMDAMNLLPEFTDLTKFVSDPVRWEVKIDGKLVTGISTAQLLEWRFIREVIADKLSRVVPMIKNAEWERLLSKVMEDVRIIDTPDDASVSGIIRSRLRDFAKRADLLNFGEDTGDRAALARGLPCVQVYDGQRMVMFRSQDFVAYLKRTRSEELKGVALWLAVRNVGVLHAKIRVGKTGTCNVWMIPVEEVLIEVSEAAPVEFTSEL